MSLPELSREDRLKLLMGLSKVYIQGKVGEDNPDFDDMCQEAYIICFEKMNSASYDRYTPGTLFNKYIVPKIDSIVDTFGKVEKHVDLSKVVYSSTDVTRRQLEDAMNSIINTLYPRERDVLYLRFGFVDGELHTLDYVADSLQLTRERIRQIEAKALRKMRHPSRSRLLKDYLSFVDENDGTPYKLVDELLGEDED